ncbi:MAG: hypothetical protein KatS3mg014_0436 [Actinomycetota bacterium]|nr:MAG: hypothetical protein KatS3mg014_0436 [Actinomycetota bacterium]
MFLAFNATFLPLFWAGLHGMNRRINAYVEPLRGYNVFASVAAFVLAAVFLIALGNLVWSWARGRVAEANPWRATTLEWTTSSPPPPHNFEQTPEVVGDPYPYGEPGATHVRPVTVPTIAGGSE